MSSAQWFRMQTEIHFGVDAIRVLSFKAGRLGKKVLLVSGRYALRQNGALEEIARLLHHGGLKVVGFAGVEPEPSLQTVAEGLAFARSEKVDLVVGMGGGSAMDVSKAIAGLYHAPLTLQEYFDGSKLDTAGLPLITIPTTAGSGAEVTVNAVLTDTERRIKKSIRSPFLAPRVAIVDPKLTLTNPPEVTAFSGFDALVQAIEAFTSKGAGPLTDIYAYDAIEKIVVNLPTVFRDGNDLAAREGMALGSLLAGIALTNARLGAVHGLAHAIGICTGKPHGLICAVLLVPVIRFNMSVCYEKYAQIAKAFGYQIQGMDPIDAAAQGVKSIMLLQRKLGIPSSISSLGIDEAEFPQIAEESLPSGSLRANSREASSEDLINILKERF